MVGIDSITVKGLYGFKNEISIKFGTSNLIVGPNNSGKTNIFKLITFLIKALSFERLPNVRYNKLERSATLKFDIHFSEEEIQDLSNFIVASLIKGTPHSGENFEKFLIEFRKLQDFLLELKFRDMGMEDIFVSEWRLSDKTTGLSIRRLPTGQYITNDGGSGQPINFTQVVENSKQSGITVDVITPDHLNQFVSKFSNPIIFNDITEPENPSDKLKFTNLKDKYGFSSRETVSFFHLLGKIIETKISYLSEQRRSVERQKLLEADKLDDDGGNLDAYLFNLHLNKIKIKREKYSEIEKQFSKILNEEVHFNIICEEKIYPTDNQQMAKEVIPKVVFEKNGITFSHDEVGAGIRELLLLLTKSKLEKESIILLDEPALHLHPLQLKVALREIIENINNSKSQIFLISHSINMPIIDFLSENNQLIYVRMIDNITHISEPNEDNKKILRLIFPKLQLDLDSEIFFSRCVILVEGDSEIGILQGLDHRLDKNIKLKDIHLVSLDSNSNLGIYLRIIGIFSIPFVCLLDRDSFTRIKEGNLSTLLKAFNEVDPRLIKEMESLDLSDIEHPMEPKWARLFREGSECKSDEIKKFVDDMILDNRESIKEYKEVTFDKLLEKFEKLNIFGIQEGTIEDLMKSVDADLYQKVKVKSKRTTAKNFINILDGHKTSKFIIVQKVLDGAIKLASQ